jgi:hypothetical protein
MTARIERMKLIGTASAVMCAIFANVAFAQDVRAEDPAKAAAIADFFVARDTDEFHTYRARVGGLYPYGNQWSYAGAIAQSTRYSQEGFRKDVAGILAVYKDQRRDTLAGLDVEAGVVRVAGHLRPIGDATWRMTPASGTAIDLIAAADLVETPKALERGIGYTFAAAGIEQQFGPRVTATGLAGWQSFSDGNARTHLRARLIWLAIPEHGATLQLRYRRYSTRDSDVGGAYFNPDDYQQWLAVAAIRKRHAAWTFTGALGAGQERSTGEGSRPSYLAEARAEGPLTADVRLVLRAGYYRSAGFIDSPDYAYRLIGASLVIPFR